MNFIKKEITNNLRWIIFAWMWLICFAVGHALVKHNSIQYLIDRLAMTLLGFVIILFAEKKELG